MYSIEISMYWSASIHPYKYLYIKNDVTFDILVSYNHAHKNRVIFVRLDIYLQAVLIIVKMSWIRAACQ